MTRGKTAIHFLTAIILVVLAIVLFCFASGKLTFDRVLKDNGKYDKGAITAFMLPLTLVILGFAGLIVAINDGLFMDWLTSAGVIALFGIVGGIFFGWYRLGAVLMAGVYFLWWGIASIKYFISCWWDLSAWQNIIVALFRLVMAGMFLMIVVFVLSAPGAMAEVGVSTYTPDLAVNAKWAGLFCIGSAVGLFVEGILWCRVCDY